MCTWAKRPAATQLPLPPYGLTLRSCPPSFPMVRRPSPTNDAHLVTLRLLRSLSGLLSTNSQKAIMPQVTTRLGPPPGPCVPLEWPRPGKLSISPCQHHGPVLFQLLFFSFLSSSWSCPTTLWSRGPYFPEERTQAQTRTNRNAGGPLYILAWGGSVSLGQPSVWGS